MIINEVNTNMIHVNIHKALIYVCVTTHTANPTAQSDNQAPSGPGRMEGMSSRVQPSINITLPERQVNDSSTRLNINSFFFNYEEKPQGNKPDVH